MSIKHSTNNDGSVAIIGATAWNATHTIDNNTITTAMLATTTVAAGSYTATNLTVGVDGRITAASNGSGGSSVSVISPAGITGTVNDWAPTGIGAATTILVTSSSSTVLLAGLTGGTLGRTIILVNADAANQMYIRNNASSSAAANRINTGYGADVIMSGGLGNSVTLQYFNSVWNVVAISTATPPPVDIQGNTTIEGSLKINGLSRITSGAGTPLGVVYGSPGDMFLRTDGGAGTSLYIKESGASTTAGWVAK
ncbi:MAG: hypothetical protein H0X39_00855 [Actinobacteria bacterium]|nr:hypothetical protein [Actinomycetota bacterium]